MARYKQFAFFLVGLFGSGLATPQSAPASFTIYSDVTSFNAASTGRTTLGFEGLAPSGSFTFYGNPGSLTQGGVGFSSNGAIFVQNNNAYGTGAYLSAQQAPANFDILTVTLPANITAIGLNIFSPNAVTITLSTGQSYMLPGGTYPNISFTGFTTDSAIASLTFSETGGLDLDNFTFGQAVAVPEPSSVVLCGLAIVGLGVTHCRRHPARSAPV